MIRDFAGIPEDLLVDELEALSPHSARRLLAMLLSGGLISARSAAAAAAPRPPVIFRRAHQQPPPERNVTFCPSARLPYNAIMFLMFDATVGGRLIPLSESELFVFLATCAAWEHKQSMLSCYVHH